MMPGKLKRYGEDVEVDPQSRSPFARVVEEGLGRPVCSKLAPSVGVEGQEAIAEWTTKFINALLLGETIARAAKKAGVHYTLPYKRRRSDPEFAAAWKEAAAIGTELLEEEAARRAFHGTDKPVYQRGVKVGVIREYSDTLLMFLLKGRKPEVYRDGYSEDGIARPTTVNITVVNVDTPKIETPEPEPSAGAVVVHALMAPPGITVVEPKQDG